MSLAVEVICVALIGGFPIWALLAVKVVDHVRYRDEHPEARALRVLGERRWWS